MSRIKDLINKKMPPPNRKNGKDDPQTLQALKLKLSQNSLSELKLGFDEDHFHSKRHVQSLIKVVKEKFLHRLAMDKHSCLTSIRIGYRLPGFAVGPILQQLIPLLLQDPVRVTHLQLKFNNISIPEDCLRTIVSCPSLECLDLRSIKVHVPIGGTTSNMTGGQHLASNSSLLRRHYQQQHHHHHHSVGHGNYHNDTTSSSTAFDDCAAHTEENIICVAPYISVNIKTLNLVDCDLKRQHIPILCDVIRRKIHGLQHLSLRHNRDLDGGYKHLFDLRCLKSLDLSLCDLDASDGYWLGRALEQLDVSSHNSGLEKLSLAGNYRLSMMIPDLISLAATRLRELDCSYCDVQGKLQARVFGILASNRNCTLRSFKMQGTRLNDVNALAEFLGTNTSLLRLVLDHPREPTYIGYHGMEQIYSAVKLNYNIQVLKIDFLRKAPVEEIVDDMEFWLELNRCGRRAVLQENTGSCKGWSTILAQAAAKDDVNVLFWLLKHGAPIMFT